MACDPSAKPHVPPRIAAVTRARATICDSEFAKTGRRADYRPRTGPQNALRSFCLYRIVFARTGARFSRNCSGPANVEKRYRHRTFR